MSLRYWRRYPGNLMGGCSMGRFVRISGMAALTLLCCSTAAHGWRFFGFRACYYAPVRMVYYPAFVVPTCYPAPVPMPQYAMPQAAPASQTGEPPLDTSKPTVIESRSQGGKYTAAKDD